MLVKNLPPICTSKIAVMLMKSMLMKSYVGEYDGNFTNISTAKITRRILQVMDFLLTDIFRLKDLICYIFENKNPLGEVMCNDFTNNAYLLSLLTPHWWTL